MGASVSASEKEALDYLVQLGKQCSGVKLYDLPGNKVLVVHADGKTETFDKDSRQRKDTVGSLASFIDWCNAEEGLLEVFVKPLEIVARVDYEKPHHAQFCTLPLMPSAPWLTLVRWAKEYCPQKEVVRMLRGVLYDTFDGAHLQAFKSIDFKRTNDGKRTVDHGRESLGKSVEQAVQSSAGTIPEMMTFNVPAFDFDGSPKVILKMAVDINMDAETFQLMPMGDTMVLAVRASMNELKDRLQAALADSPVYISQ